MRLLGLTQGRRPVADFLVACAASRLASQSASQAAESRFQQFLDAGRHPLGIDGMRSATCIGMNRLSKAGAATGASWILAAMTGDLPEPVIGIHGR